MVHVGDVHGTAAAHDGALHEAPSQGAAVHKGSLHIATLAGALETWTVCPYAVWLVCTPHRTARGGAAAVACVRTRGAKVGMSEKRGWWDPGEAMEDICARADVVGASALGVCGCGRNTGVWQVGPAVGTVRGAEVAHRARLAWSSSSSATAEVSAAWMCVTSLTSLPVTCHRPESMPTTWQWEVSLRVMWHRVPSLLVTLHTTVAAPLTWRPECSVAWQPLVLHPAMGGSLLMERASDMRAYVAGVAPVGVGGAVPLDAMRVTGLAPAAMAPMVVEPAASVPWVTRVGVAGRVPAGTGASLWAALAPMVVEPAASAA